MSDWLDVDEVSNLPHGSVRLVRVNGREVAVFNVEGDFFAIEDICPHDGGTLADGEVEDHEIICPRHGARFDLRTGEVTLPPAYEDIVTFPVRVHEGVVQVRAAGEAD